MSALPKPPADHVHAIQYRMDQLFKLWRTTSFLGTADIVRLNETIAKLSESDLRRVAAFAEGLAEWSDPAPGSSDGSKANR